MLAGSFDGDPRAVVEATGWEVDHPVGAQVHSERIGDESAFAMRMWSSALSARWREMPANLVWRMIIVLEGAIEVHNGAGSITIQGGAGGG